MKPYCHRSPMLAHRHRSIDDRSSIADHPSPSMVDHHHNHISSTIDDCSLSPIDRSLTIDHRSSPNSGHWPPAIGHHHRATHIGNRSPSSVHQTSFIGDQSSIANCHISSPSVVQSSIIDERPSTINRSPSIDHRQPSWGYRLSTTRS